MCVADAKECSEGVSFFGVRRLLLVDVPLTAVDLMQRVGRAVRFMGHDRLSVDERRVDVRLYAAVIDAEADKPKAQRKKKAKPAKESPPQARTADEELVGRLRKNVLAYYKELTKLQKVAVDHGMWQPETDAQPGAASGQGSSSAADEPPSGLAADSGSDSEVDPPAEEEERREEQRRRPPPPPPPRDAGPPPRQPPPPPPRPSIPTAQLPVAQAIAHLIALASRKPASRHAKLVHLVDMLGVPVPASPYDDAPRSMLKKNWLWVCRIVHPDKCNEAGAVEAFRAVDDAYKAYQAAGPLS